MSKAHTSETRTGGHVWSAIRHHSVAAPGIADLLGLAAAPTFAIMALLSSINGGSPVMLCLPAQDPSPLNGMTLMYLLMSVFHSAPWLKLAFSRQGGICRS